LQSEIESYSKKIQVLIGKLVPTDIGTIVTDFLVKNFGNILDYNFTAKVEQDFDEIEGNVNWTEMRILINFINSKRCRSKC
jgi:DNA topoisomerase IA